MEQESKVINLFPPKEIRQRYYVFVPKEVVFEVWADSEEAAIAAFKRHSKSCRLVTEVGPFYDDAVVKESFDVSE